MGENDFVFGEVAKFIDRRRGDFGDIRGKLKCGRHRCVSSLGGMEPLSETGAYQSHIIVVNDFFVGTVSQYLRYAG